MCDALLRNQVDESNRINNAHNDSGATLVHAGHCPATATDVEQRHRGKVDGVWCDFPDLLNHWSDSKEVLVREHDTLRQTSGAA